MRGFAPLECGFIRAYAGFSCKPSHSLSVLLVALAVLMVSVKIKPTPVTGRVPWPTNKLEPTVLSPHEFAVLLLVNDGAESDDLDRADVEALIERQLVTLERRGPDHSYARVTLQGYALLKASGHVRTYGRRTMAVSH